MGRAETWVIRSAQAAAVAAWLLLLLTSWRLPWLAQLAVIAVVWLQFSTIGRLAARRAAWSHAWLRGYFAALEDVAAPEDVAPPEDAEQS